MKHDLTVAWKDGNVFASEIMNHTLIVDGKPPEGETSAGPTPKPLLLMALAGCSGIDIVGVLKKMRVPFDSFTLQITGTTADDHPMYYKHIRVEYIFKGDEAHRSKIEKAVSLSENQYCGVRATLRPDIHYESIITIQ